MQNIETMIDVSVIWRGNKYVVGIASNASIKDLGDELQKLTGVKADTMKLIAPQFSGKTSKLLAPFSDEHSGLSLPEASIFEGKSIRMMGVSEDEVDKVLQSAKVDMRIAGFDEEEKRMKQRMSAGSPPLFKLPQGPYIFCDFQTLEIPGIELNPPASEALKRMHMLASDPGIVAIMNKHQWQVGIMTEMAPVGYVGVSPKCILGLNKNHGEEISLRLRTDDLKGFRKYETIKKTLLHELAHMVYSEHDANFYALDKQLNQEANSLDWTRSRGHTLGRVSRLDNFDEEFDVTDNISLSQKLGGNVSDQLENARASSVAAAYRRLANAPVNRPGESEVHEEPDPDDSGFNDQVKHDSTYAQKDSMTTDVPDKNQLKADNEADPDEHSCDPDKYEVDPAQDNHCQAMEILNPMVHPSKIADELGQKQDEVKKRNSEKFVEDAHLQFERMEEHVHLDKGFTEPDPDESHENKEVPDSDDSRANNPDQYLASSMLAKENPNEDLVSSQGISRMQIDEPDPDDQELQRIQDPVTFVCQKLQKAIDLLRAEVKTTEATAALQTLHMIISNVIEHPDEVKYKRLRKANPIIQRNVANHKAAMEILQMIGFSEDAVFNEFGKSETYLVLKRNDPGLLWLAKSSLEACIPC